MAGFWWSDDDCADRATMTVLYVCPTRCCSVISRKALMDTEHENRPASHMERELWTQPECWVRATAIATEVAGLLPKAGERVAVVGCGTSWFIGQSYAAAREIAGQGETDAFTPSEMPTRRRYDRVVLLSRSGTTTEVLALQARLRGLMPVVAITAEADAPLARAADGAIILDFADEKSVVQTRFATTELALLRAHLGHDLGPATEAARRILSSSVPKELERAHQFTFLGAGLSCGLASEAALKLREAAGMWTEAYPAMEYRHGPIAATQQGSVVWLLSPPPDGLVNDIVAAGGLVWYEDIDPLAGLVRVHQLAAACAYSRGQDPDRPRNLTRSVILLLSSRLLTN
jgi:fructoselysine-6-P-deglycase FrlB-like protein